MKSIKFLALATMFGAMDSASYGYNDKTPNKRVLDNTKPINDNINIKKGLTKFNVCGIDIWALNKKSALKKHNKMLKKHNIGLITNDNQLKAYENRLASCKNEDELVLLDGVILFYKSLNL